MKKFKFWTLHPFFLAVFPILFLCAHNIHELPLLLKSVRDIYLPLGISLGVTAATLVVLGFATRRFRLSALVVSLAVLFFALYGHAKNWLSILPSEDSTLFFRLYINLYAILVVFLVFFLRKKSLEGTTYFLNVITGVMVFMMLFRIGSYTFTKPDLHVAEEIQSETQKEPFFKNPDEYPDIYYIVTDEYAGARSLKEYLNYDNSDFVHFLQDRGFFVPSDSRSNYMYTLFSMASSLNMEYINYLADQVGVTSTDYSVPIAMLKKNKIAQFLKKRGYKFILVSSHMAILRDNPYADIEIGCYSISDFQRMLIDTSMLSQFYAAGFDLDPGEGGLKAHMHCLLDKLANIHKIKGPKFIVAHIFPPHFPAMFDRDGNPTKPVYFFWKRDTGKDTSQYQKPYLEMLMYVTKQMKVLVDQLVNIPDRKPIVVIQGDHGTQMGPGYFDDGYTINKDLVRERFGILNAYFMPHELLEHYYDSITAVNSFRILLREGFGADLPNLPDRLIYSQPEFFGHPYKFVDVTNYFGHLATTKNRPLSRNEP